MKKYFLLFTLTFLGLSFVQAQDVQEGIAKMSQGDQNSFVINTPSIDAKLAIDIWKKFMKSYKGKTKYDKKTGEIFTDDAEADMLSDNSFDVYARPVESGKEVVAMAVWFDLGGAYLSSFQHTEAAIHARQMLIDYRLAVEEELAKDVLASEENKYKKIEKELQKLDKKVKKLNKEIDQAREVIQKAEKEIDENEALRRQLQGDLLEQNEAVRAAEAPVKDAKRKKNR